MDDTTKRTQAKIERKITRLKKKLDKLERAEEKRVEAYERECEPFYAQLGQLEAELFRLNRGYGVGDKLLITQEYCDLKIRTGAMGGLQVSQLLGLEAVIEGASEDSVSISTALFGTGIRDIRIIQGMREAWLAKNGGQS